MEDLETGNFTTNDSLYYARKPTDPELEGCIPNILWTEVDVSHEFSRFMSFWQIAYFAALPSPRVLATLDDPLEPQQTLSDAYQSAL